MSSRSAQKTQARAARLAAEAAERRRERLRRWALLAVVVAAASGAVALAVLLGGAPERPAAPKTSESAALLAGIPQDGVSLGDPDAPVVLEEFADLQCPFCRDYATTVLPALVREYVRTGKVRLVYRDLAFLGEDSREAATFAAAAGAQDKLWQVVDRIYADQGAENSGYVTEEFLRDAGAQVDGLDVERALRERGDGGVGQQLAEARARATTFAIRSTPTFVLDGPGGKARVLDLDTTDVDAFRGALDQALAAR